MKYRNDFVTNSSSSSFIVAYKDKESMLNDLNKFAQGIEEWNEEQYKAVVFDIVKNRLTYEEAVELVREFALDECWNKFAIKFDRDKYPTQGQWVRSDEYKALCDEHVSSAEQKFRRKFKKSSWISKLWYSDSGGFYEINANLGNLISGVYMRKFG